MIIMVKKKKKATKKKKTVKKQIKHKKKKQIKHKNKTVKIKKRIKKSRPNVKATDDRRPSFVRGKEKKHKDLFVSSDEFERADVGRENTECMKCGFKAAYKFKRCPSCDATVVEKEDDEE